MAATAVPITRWQGCYGDSWQDLIVPEAFAHPAKVARGLSHRIYRHLLDSGYVRPGMVVLDPFAGIGGFCLDAMTYGLRYVGVELEPRFCALGQQNLALWRQRYGFTGGTIVQGDSRQLRQVLQGVQAGCCIGSPPFAGCLSGIAHPEKLNGMALNLDGSNRLSRSAHIDSYGATPGQLGAMPPGQVECVVGSPPWHAQLDVDHGRFHPYSGGSGHGEYASRSHTVCRASFTGLRHHPRPARRHAPRGGGGGGGESAV